MAYNFRTNTWTRDYCPASTDATRAYSFQTTVVPVVNGRAYLVGGFSAESLEDWWTYDDFTIFDIESRTWESGPSLLEPRDTHLTVVSRDTIYVVGGHDDVNAKDTVFALRLPGAAER
jgi:Kelch motif protein